MNNRQPTTDNRQDYNAFIAFVKPFSQIFAFIPLVFIIKDMKRGVKLQAQLFFISTIYFINPQELAGYWKMSFLDLFKRIKALEASDGK
ncbi:MAG: hypothetical protein LBD22_04550 [Spirochaetaceae bacterium]|jgi:hypothetical protein|nr:hypothetical protein [Spirochaetaceae bacterium]